MSHVHLVSSWLVVAVLTGSTPASASEVSAATAGLFVPSTRCIACHNQLVSSRGEDVSIASDWRGSLMANAARDPYWLAGVRRETIDHPALSAAIEDECAKCHMPMARTRAHAEGGKGQVFAHETIGATAPLQSRLAGDGVSCSACHQITAQNLGAEDSFSGHYVIDTERTEARAAYGPVAVGRGLATVMRSAASFNPEQTSHLQEAAFCATCHTLFTHSIGKDGEVVGEFPEQVPYLEWLAGSYADEESCQSCHMPEADGKAPFASVLAWPRADFSAHVFRGGNVLMPHILADNAAELGVVATREELAQTAARTAEHLSEDAAQLDIDTQIDGEQLQVTVSVSNFAGHKLPTAYPSRRVWIHLRVADEHGVVVFESGALEPTGAIAGNDNDEDPQTYEPHYERITDPTQVQIYEPILGDPDGAVTTGLLRAVTYLKDNRIPPDGFDKASVGAAVAVHGAAFDDDDFTGGSDQVEYGITAPASGGPYVVTARLLYQPIAYRWAMNHADYDAEENQRFVRYYNELSDRSAVVLVLNEAATE